MHSKAKNLPQMKFGICGVNLSTNVDHINDVVSVVKYAEELGYDTAWLSDRLRDTYVNLAACAMATSKIRLATGMVNPFTRHPVINARAVATLDELSNGRMSMGFAAGNMIEMTKDLGFETKGGYSRVREACLIAKRLFRGETVTFEGKHFQVHDIKLGVKPRHDIQICIAGQGPKILEVSGEVGDASIIPYTDPKVVDLAKKCVRAGAEKAGKNFEDVRLISWPSVYITDDKQDVLDSLRGYAALMVILSPMEWMQELGMREEEYETVKKGYVKGAHVDQKLEAEFVKKAKEYITDDVVQLYTIVGKTQEVIDRIGNLNKQGFSEFSLWVPTPVLPEKRRVLENFASEVIVRFRD
jgi:5,10-methylenetetrahydromethanopterin reductase